MNVGTLFAMAAMMGVGSVPGPDDRPRDPKPRPPTEPMLPGESWLDHKLRTDPAFARTYRLIGERQAAAEAKRARRKARNLRAVTP